MSVASLSIALRLICFPLLRWESALLPYCIPQQLACTEGCPKNAFPCFSTGPDFCGPPHLFVACVALLFCQLSHSLYVYQYLCVLRDMKQDQGVVDADVHCPSPSHQYSPGNSQPTWGISRAPGSASRGQFGWHCPACLCLRFWGDAGELGRRL